MRPARHLLSPPSPARWLLALAVALGVLAGLAVIAQALLLARVIDGIFLGGQALSDVAPWLVLLVLVAVGRAGAGWAQEVVAQRAASGVKTDTRDGLTRRLLALGPTYVLGERSGELVNTAVEGVEALDPYVSQYLPQVALAVLVPTLILLAVLPLDLLSGVILLLTAPLIPLFMVLIGNQAQALTERRWDELSRLSAHFLDVLQGLPTLKLFGRAHAQARVIEQVSQRFGDVTMQVLRVAFLSALSLEFIATLSVAIIAVQIGLRLLNGGIAFLPALTILILAPEFYLPLRQLAVKYHNGMAGVEAIKRIEAVMGDDQGPRAKDQREDHRPPTADHQEDTQLNAPVGPSSSVLGRPVGPSSFVLRPPPGALAFARVSYRYADDRDPALRDVSFTIPSGKTVAVVGASGAGKSTLARLLMRFMEPTDGVIRVGDTPLSALTPTEWRAGLAWVPQAPHLFYGSVLDNIRLARPDASHEQVAAAAEAAGASRFIAALPQGYDTPVGEGGARLSGGQRQQIALARAFLRDAPIVILDEATANLDGETEAAVRAALARLMQGRSVLLIAHRLHLVADADEIVVLDGGELVERGPHADLLARDGVYRRLVAAYAAREAS